MIMQRQWARSVKTMIVGLTLLLAGATGAVAQAGPTTVIIVRHAEKAAEPASDPGLTAVGEQRTRDLTAAVRDQRIDAIITTQYLRTRATAAPIAAERHLEPEIVASTPGQDHPKAVAEAIRRHAGQTVLVVGHSNTVPAIIAALGAPSIEVICDSSYDQLFVVTIPSNGSPSLLRVRFGVRTPDGSGCPTMK